VALLLALAVSGAAPQDKRVEVEIHQKRFEVGPPRYSVPVSIDGRAPIEAMLDTGSTGLRVLPSAGPLEAKGGRPNRYTYRNGVVLTGLVTPARVTIGGVETRVAVSATSAVSCSQDRPSCPAAATTPEQYRIGGSNPSEGYSAILGAGLRAGDAENPLAHIGDQSWIVLLPKVGDAAPGKLILNPTPAERAKFTVFSLAKDPRGRGPFWADNAVPTCLSREGGGARLCAPTLLDSGAPGLNYISRSAPASADWPVDSNVSLAFGPSENQALKQSFVLGRGPGARLNFSSPPASLPWEGLNAGVLPFYDFAVLYDAKAGMIGLARREDFLAP
jgi:hypothetical protein